MEVLNLEQIRELDFHTSEAYKTLRTNIEFSGKDIRVITFTSATPNEGKSSTCMNLAIAIAQSGKRVVLVDADLRKSVLVGRYKIGKVENGLSHYLSGQKGIPEVTYETSVENLYTIFAGPVPPNPAELLGSEMFTTLVNELKEIFDYVIIDSPPLGSVIDTAVISKVCDGAIIVFESGKISYRFAQKITNQLIKANCRILGTVLNKVKVTKKGYYGAYYGKYYGSYYGEYYGNEEK